jgi:alkane 1-monooxygenase
MEDKRFLIPLYLYLLVDTLTLFWAFIVVSDKIHIDHPLFQNQLNSPIKWFSFIYVWGYTQGIGGLAAHELIHKREAVHKIFGTFQFSKILYSHFLFQHISGHHKRLATVDDPASALKGDNLYGFALKSALVGYYNTWVRETDKVIKSIADDNASFLYKLII